MGTNTIMYRMKIVVSLLVLCCRGTAAFVVPLHHGSTMTPTTTTSFQALKKTTKTILYSSPPTDGEETTPSTPSTTSFQDAGSAIVDEQDEQRMKSMGDFDSNTDVSFFMGRGCLCWEEREIQYMIVMLSSLDYPLKAFCVCFVSIKFNAVLLLTVGLRRKH
jgi:hypothetical protein